MRQIRLSRRLGICGQSASYSNIKEVNLLPGQAIAGFDSTKKTWSRVTIYGSKGTIQLDRNFYKHFDLGGNLIKSEKEDVISKTTDTGPRWSGC